MSVVKQLYQLQEIDLKLESNEKAQNQIIRQLVESQEVIRVKAKLASEQQRSKDLSHQQYSAEYMIEGLTNKLMTTEDKLYSGGITNPKELTNLQREASELRARRAQLEETTLEIIDQVEHASTIITNLTNNLNQLETEWHNQQQQLSTDLQKLKTTHANLKHDRGEISTEIDSQATEFYNQLRKQKGTAVAKVEQGTCRGCQIALPTTELQQARIGNLVRCSSCGRILFLA